MSQRHLNPRLGLALIAAVLMLPMRAAAEECVQRDMPNTVYAGDPASGWTSSLMGSGTIGITGTNPRSGNGSLEGWVNGSLFDWSFFRRAEGSAWGLLSDINCLSFEWWREAPGLGSPIDATWINQTPAFRVLIKEGDSYSQLIWEGWYNNGGATANGTWNFSDITNALFWRHFEGGLEYTYQGCANTSFQGSSTLLTHTLAGWVQNCYSPTAEVYGIMLGLGSYWPAQYHAWFDNVQLSFGRNGFVVEDNFELPETAAPEPATLILLGTGLSSLAGAGYLKRRRRNNPNTSV
ncbi:MAG: PEP-CTERM sorting domain-containing protein [Gemmatimonadales bacterium]